MLTQELVKIARRFISRETFTSQDLDISAIVLNLVGMVPFSRVRGPGGK